MIVSLLTIGNELLKGATINTNASWIGKNLFKVGAQLNKQITVKDNHSAIISALNYLFEGKPDLVIITGGLGPTADDITRETLFEYFGANAILDEFYWKELSEYFEKRLKKPISENNRSQALVPDIGEIVPNPVGSARGFKFKKDNTTFFSLPGVPLEMKEMITNSIIPWINDHNLIVLKQIKFRTSGKPESAIATIIEPILNEYEHYEYGFFPSAYGVDIIVTGIDEGTLNEIDQKITFAIPELIFTKSDQNIENVIVKLLAKNNRTLSTAESCTGGLIGHRITQISGSSSVYHGGIISYSNEVKEKQLKVKHDTLISHGAVSEETAKEMASGVRLALNADIGLSITGIAGPTGGTQDKPIGLVFIGYSDKDVTFGKKLLFGKNRSLNKIRSSQAALNLLYKELMKDI